jgi:hypothetical protein
MKRALFTAALASAIVLGGAVACDDVSSPQSERISMALAVSDARAASGGEVSLVGSGPDDPIIIVRGRQRLRLDLVELNLTRVDLRRVESDDDDDTDLDTDTDFDTDSDSDTDTDTDTDRGDADFVRFRTPVTVALPLGGGVIAPFTTVVPVGTYDRVRFRVQSAHVVGAFDEDLDGEFEAGEAFSVTVPVRQDFTLRIRPPLVVTDGTPSNVTIALQPPEWFRNHDRTLINPRRLNSDHQLRARFRQVIRATLRAFRDANRNGIDDRDTDR